MYLISDLCKVYNKGRSTGSVDVRDLGLTLGGKAIAELVFERNCVLNIIYVNSSTRARFQDWAPLDD